MTLPQIASEKLAAVTIIQIKDINKSVTPTPDRYPDTVCTSVKTPASVSFKQASTGPSALAITTTMKFPGHYFYPPLRALIPVLLAVGCAAPHPHESETLLPGRNVFPAREIRVAMQGTVDFSRHVKPILAAKCVACHDRGSQPQGVHFDSRANATKSGALGVFIVPGHPERSPFLTSIKSAHRGVTSMPPVGERLTSEEVGLLYRWIQQGAPWPASE